MKFIYSFEIRNGNFSSNVGLALTSDTWPIRPFSSDLDGTLGGKIESPGVSNKHLQFLFHFYLWKFLKGSVLPILPDV